MVGLGSEITVAVDGLQRLVELLADDGFDVVGPVVVDDALVVRSIRSVDDLPLGWTTVSEPGSVRLRPRADRARFGWALTSTSWKAFVHPPRVRTMTLTQPGRDGSVAVEVAPAPSKPQALLGVRPCELAALECLDAVLVDRPPSPDPTYQQRRRAALVVVVNCATPDATCFCASMGTGPHVDGRFETHDLELTELLDEQRPTAEPRYAIAPVSARGERLVERLRVHGVAAPYSPSDQQTVDAIRSRATTRIGRSLDADAAADTLPGVHDDERWNEIADRCLACGNCTAVCPTCFCSRIDDVGDLAGTHIERWRSWDSCFSLEFSRVGDAPVRSSVASRYRQWMTHKLSTWHDQFGASGCVGCGRCIGWCPVGIDFTAEAGRFLPAREVSG